jgi:hypothetical protein
MRIIKDKQTWIKLDYERLLEEKIQKLIKGEKSIRGVRRSTNCCPAAIKGQLVEVGETISKSFWDDWAC